MDYNEEWNRQFKASTGQRKNYYEKKEHAKSYDYSNTVRLDGEMRAGLFQVQPHWIALDIGSGPGTLTIPLARRLKKVTAVEPSAAMIECLLEHKKDEKLKNIDIIHDKWEDVDINGIDTYDLVVASYSLSMIDIKDALLKMNQVARKNVCLYWFAGVPSWEQIKLDLYPIIKKQEYMPLPKCDIIYNVLYELGIYPDITVLKDTCFNREFNDMNSTVEDLKKRLDVTCDSFNDILIDYIKKHYISKDNKLIFMDNTKYIKVSWTPVDSIRE